MDQLLVVVAVCTYRRPQQLALLLAALQQQDLSSVPGRVELLVVDNSPDGEAAAVAASSDGPLHVRYVAHGAQNIASGRNATLRAAQDRARFIALIDDDEVPAPDWLHRLLQAQAETHAEVVTGPVMARYPPGTPEWLQRDQFYSVVEPEEGFVVEAVSGNALVSCELVRRLSLSFDESLGTSGGEDQLFFRAAQAGGARLWYAPGATVHEQVPQERLSVRYLLRREYRKGNTLGLLDRSRPGWPAGRPHRRRLVSAYWLLSGLLRALVGLLRRDRAIVVAGAMRAARGAGMVSGLRGRTYALYSRRPPRKPVVALVVDEDPQYQAAGHSQFLRGFVSHYENRGARVVVVLTAARLSFLIRRRTAVEYRSPGLRNWGPLQVVGSPAVAARQLAWRSFRRAPRPAQSLADHVRTAARARRQVDHRLGSWLDPARSGAVTRALHEEQPDVVLFSGLFSVPKPLALPDSVHSAVLVSHDVVSQRAEQFRQRGYRVEPADFSEQDERAALEPFSTIVAIQWDDAGVFRRLAPHATVVVVPVSVDVTVDDRQPVPGRCLFVGSGSLANVDGLRWFLDDCWPHVRARAPEAELHVVGTVCARVGAVPDGVVLRGEVARLDEEYARATVALVPLRTGSGLKVKIVEALCAGVPVVTTAVGAQGLSGLFPRPFLLADTPEDFTEHVVRLLFDETLRTDLERSAVTAAPLFSPESAFSGLDEALRSAGVALPPGPA